MKNPLDALYAHHEEAEQLFAQSEDIHARNELAHEIK
jgi:hypothetical protein